MASYGTKYVSHFASKLGVVGTVYFKKIDYSGSIDEIKLLKGGVQIDYKWKDWFNPIIGQSCSLSLLNDSSNYFSFEDLYAPDDYEWQVIVDVSNNKGDNIELFNGFLNPEPMDARYLLNSAFRLTASGYLNKLDEVSPDILDSSTNTDHQVFIDYFNSCLRETVRDSSLWVNMTLEPSGNLAESVSDTFGAWQKTGVSPEVFFKDQYDKDGVVNILTKILKPFNSYMYSWDGKWMIERYNDLDPETPKYWRVYDTSLWYGQTLPSSYVLSNDPSYNITDFNQVSYSQQLKIETSFSKFIVKKSLDEWSNLTNNYFDYDDGDLDYPAYCREVTHQFYTSNVPKVRKWDVYSNSADGFESFAYNGTNRQNGFMSNRLGPEYPRFGISNTIQKFGWPQSNPNYTALLSTRFLATVDDIDVDASGNIGGNTMNISFKYMPRFGVSDPEEKDIYVRFYWFLRDYVPSAVGTTNYWIVKDVDDQWERIAKGSGSVSLDNVNTEYLSISGDTKYGKQCTEFSVDIPLSEVTNLPTGDRQFIFGIMAEAYSTNGQDGSYSYVPCSMVGDFVITIDGISDSDTESGEITDAVFKKETSVDLDLFDVSTLNTPSSVLGGTYLDQRTSIWSEESDGSTGYSLVQHLINDRFKIYHTKSKEYTTSIRTDTFFKPLSIFYDDQDPSVRKYVLGNYAYTPDKDEYKMDLKEWDNTDYKPNKRRSGRYNDGKRRRGTVRDPKDYTGRSRTARGGTRTVGGSDDPRYRSRDRSPTVSSPTGTTRTRSTYTTVARKPVAEPVRSSGDELYIYGKKTFRDPLRSVQPLYIGPASMKLGFNDVSTFYMHNMVPGKHTYFTSQTTGDVSVNMIGINGDTGIELIEDVSISKSLFIKGTRFDVSIGGIGSPQDGSALVFDFDTNSWTYGVISTDTLVGDVSIGGDVFVTGTGTFQQDVSIYGTLFTVDISYNNITQWDSSLSNLTVSGDASIEGNLYVGNSVDITNLFQNKIVNDTPASISSGTTGDIKFDASYLYICYATNQWARTLMESGY